MWSTIGGGCFPVIRSIIFRQNGRRLKGKVDFYMWDEPIPCSFLNRAILIGNLYFCIIIKLMLQINLTGRILEAGNLLLTSQCLLHDVSRGMRWDSRRITPILNYSRTPSEDNVRFLYHIPLWIFSRFHFFISDCPISSHYGHLFNHNQCFDNTSLRMNFLVSSGFSGLLILCIYLTCIIGILTSLCERSIILPHRF